MVGSVGPRPQDRAYFERIQFLARGFPIAVEEGVSEEVLAEAYGRASIYWHATGYGESERRNPAGFEHFGVAAVEAMSAGAVPLVYDGGGLKETVQPSVSGFRWRGVQELRGRTWDLVRDAGLRARMSAAARLRSREFSDERFVREILGIVESLDAGEPRGAAGAG